jgi:aldose 1-epimerase
VAQLRDVQLHTRITSSLNRLVVFTEATRDYVAIEPVSHVNNAINLMALSGATAEELGVHVLQPGDSMSAEMSIQVERAK